MNSLVIMGIAYPLNIFVMAMLIAQTNLMKAKSQNVAMLELNSHAITENALIETKYVMAKKIVLTNPTKMIIENVISDHHVSDFLPRL